MSNIASGGYQDMGRYHQLGHTHVAMRGVQCVCGAQRAPGARAMVHGDSKPHTALWGP